MASADESRAELMLEDVSDDDEDVDLILKIKKILPSEFTNNWAQGIRDINLEADNWNGIVAKQNIVIKLDFTRWGLNFLLKQLALYLERMTCLRSLTLDENDAHLEGSLEDIGNLTNLDTLSLARSSLICGELSSLSKINNLRAIFCEHTNVTGNISGLHNLTELMVISLSYTSITGTLKSCASFRNIVWLLLSDSQISGNISALKQCYTMERLTLNNTSVHGQIQALAHLSSIRGIGLANTEVSGELMHLATLTALKGIRLDGSKVTPVKEIDIFSFKARTGCENVIVPE